MIKKINSINQLAVFDGFEWDKTTTDVNGKPKTFGKINILYGRNYSGKTTLSRIFRAFEIHELPEKYDSPEFTLSLKDGTSLSQDNLFNSNLDIRVFNEDFVHANLRFLIDPNAEIEPFAILGKNNSDIETAIKQILDELGDNTINAETGLYNKLIEATKKYDKKKEKYQKYDNELQTKLKNEAIDAHTGIKYNASRFGDQNYNITKLNSDISCVLSSSYSILDEQTQQQHEQTILELVKSPVPRFVPQLVDFNELCLQVSTLLKKKIEITNKIAELLADIALSNWVRQGVKLHENKTICAFCGNPISDERMVTIHAHFDKESQNLEAEIDLLIEKFQEMVKMLPSAFKIDKSLFYTKYHEKIDECLNDYSVNIAIYIEQINDLIKQLLNKKSRLAEEISFNSPIDNSSKLAEIYATYNDIVDENNKYSSGLDKEKKNAQKALKLQEVYKFCIAINYNNMIVTKNTLAYEAEESKKELATIQKSINDKKCELKEKQRLLNDEEEGARRANNYLKDYFCHNYLSLQAEKVDDGQSRIRFKIFRKDKPAFNLSEGECSLISFCYFMAKLDDIETQMKKPIIWIDDPISSLDSNHVFYVYSLILAEIVKKGNWTQLFISTHNLDFLKYLRRLNAFEIQPNSKSVSVEKGYYIIQRNGERSSIQVMPKYLSEYATEYNYLFSRILECSEIEAVDDSNHDLVYNFGNTARRFLEIHLYFKYPDMSESSEKLRKFFGADVVTSELINRLCNESSHGSLEQAQKIGELPESILVAKKIIIKLQEDTEQYESLSKSIK